MIERKDITDNATEITVTRPRAAKAEKSKFESVKKTKQTVAKDPSSNQPNGSVQKEGGRLTSESIAWKIYEQAKWISEQHFYYVYGDGHSGFHADTIGGLEGGVKETSPLRGEGLDCSGAVSWALHTAGAWPGPEPPLVDPPGPMDTRQLAHWGEPGEGEFVTLWVINSTAQEHCYLEIKIPSEDRPEGGPDVEYEFEASHTGATEPAPHGVGLRPLYKGKIPGFEPRHWPGT